MFTAVVETGIRRKKKEFSWKNIEDACKKRKLYTKLYRMKLLDELDASSDQQLEKLEKDLNLLTIVMARSKAEIETKTILESRKNKVKPGWFSSWFGDSSTNKDVIQQFKNEVTPEEKKKFYQAIDYEENSLLEIYPPEYIAYRFNFNITLFQISIKDDNATLVNMTLDLYRLEGYFRPTSLNVFVKNDLDSLAIVGMNKLTILEHKHDKEFLSFKFEMNPLDKQFDFAVDLFMKSATIIYDIETINHLFQIFEPPENISLEEIQTYAQYKFGDLKQMTSLGLEYAIQKHKQLKLNILLDPSFVIVPKFADFSKANSVLLLSLGRKVFIHFSVL